MAEKQQHLFRGLEFFFLNLLATGKWRQKIHLPWLKIYFPIKNLRKISFDVTFILYIMCDILIYTVIHFPNGLALPSDSICFLGRKYMYRQNAAKVAKKKSTTSLLHIKVLLSL